MISKVQTPDSALAPLREKTVAILGYGNQGRAHALNLRDSGVRVVVGSRVGGNARRQSVEDGFEGYSVEDAAAQAEVVIFLFPDTVIATVYREITRVLHGKAIGFAHGFAYHFGYIVPLEGCRYFLVGPKGAGALLRSRFEQGSGLPAVFAVAEPGDSETVALARAYASAIGCAGIFLKETTFKEETETDLFGEQAVLCGGIVDLMRQAFEVLTERGYDPEVAFLETCFEAQLILQLWMKHGPSGMTERISPTAFYGGRTRGEYVLGPDCKDRMHDILNQIQSGEFSSEWMKEASSGASKLASERKRIRESQLEEVYQTLRSRLFSK